MKIIFAIALVYVAGVTCGIPLSWAVNSKMNPLFAAPFALVLIAGAVTSALFYAPR